MTTRREFLKEVAVGSAVMAVGARSYARIIGANDRVNFAVIGLHGRAYAHMEAIRKSPDAAITYVCDVDRRELEKFSAAVKEKFNRSPIREKDFRKALESRDVDAITIATPEHWHAPMAIMGLQAGKHVYVEKPCSHNPHEGGAAGQGAEEVRQTRADGKPATIVPTYHRHYDEDQGWHYWQTVPWQVVVC